MASTPSTPAAGSTGSKTKWSFETVISSTMVARQYCPPEVQQYLLTTLKNFISRLPRYLTMNINEFDGFLENVIYTAAEMYLASLVVTPNIQHVTVSKTPSDRNIRVAMEINESYTDTYKGVKFKWSLASNKIPTRVLYTDDGVQSTSRSDQKSFQLSFHRRHNDLALNEYLPFILNLAKVRKQQQRTVRLYSMDYSSWESVNMDHPSTFATLAIDPQLKEKLITDLDRFVRRRDQYRRVGKAWKRGYLLYGPPGTGKSSLIAAMANHLKFDIYDLELTAIRSNSILRKLLVATSNRSILVVEDIDCSMEFHDRLAAEEKPSGREEKVTLSGFLNFVDGLWSSCGDERIIVFTTNHKEKLDPALLRPGRMDVHVEMSYCTPHAFRVMASTYLGVTEHDAFGRIDCLLGKLEITPAQIGEQLLSESEPELALDGLIRFLDEKMLEKLG